MGLIGEFKKFAMRGNVVDMAVGIIIGGAFGKIVSSLVGDIIMPPVGMLMGNKDFTKYSVVLRKATENAAGQAVPAVTWGYGMFITTVIDFLIVALAMFILVKMMNVAKSKQEAAPAPPPAPSAQEKLLSEIRDILKSEKT